MAYLESSWKDCKTDIHVIQTSIQWMSTINDTAVCGDNFVVTEMKYAASNCVSEIMIHVTSYTNIRELSEYGTKPICKK